MRQLLQGAVLPGSASAGRACWKPAGVGTNVKSLQNTAEMRTVVSSRLSGASPVLFQENILNIKLLMLRKGSGPVLKDFCLPSLAELLMGLMNVRVFGSSYSYFQLWELPAKLG